MKIYAYNSNRLFCCSIRTIKKTFSNTDIHINFGVLTTRYSTSIHDKNHYFYKKNIKGKVISSIQMVNGMTQAILSFYPIKKEESNEKMIEYFENEILPQIYLFYIEHSNNPNDNFEYILLVELLDGKMNIKKGKL